MELPWQSVRLHCGEGEEEEAGVFTCVYGDVEELSGEVAIFRRAPSQEQAPSVGVRQQSHVDQYLVAEHVDVQFVGHVSYQFHEQFSLVQQAQLLAPFSACSRSVQNQNRETFVKLMLLYI